MSNDLIPVRHLKNSFLEDHFSIRSITPLVENQDLIHELHRHDFYFILFIKNGTGEHEIDFIKYNVENYSVFFVRPGQVHQLKLKVGTTGYILQFTSEFYDLRQNQTSVVLRKIRNKNHFQITLERFEKIDLHLQNIIEEFKLKHDWFKVVTISSLDIIFVELVRQSDATDPDDNKSQLYSQERLEVLQDLLEDNIKSKKQASDYAEMMSLTPYQLNSITKKLLHKNCSDVINEHIILEAKRILIGTSNQVNQIAYNLGYDDPSYFIRFFKKHTGHTPDAFRQKFR